MVVSGRFDLRISAKSTVGALRAPLFGQSLELDFSH
jgi:hypothetical protein